MAIDFPASPTIGDTFVVGTVTYTWDGTKWTAIAGAATPDKIEEGNTSAEVIDTGSDGRFVVTTDGTEALRVTNQQRVGIGTASPGTFLDVSGNGNIVRLGDGTNTFDVRFKGPNNWAVQLDTSTDKFNIQRNSSPFVTVANTGSVGIGTTSPSANGKLTVANADQQGICFVNTDSSNKEWRIAGASTSLAVIQAGVGEALRVDSGNRLLVGTSSARTTYSPQDGVTATPTVQIEGADQFGLYYAAANTTGSRMFLAKARASMGLVSSGDELGLITFCGSDGNFLRPGGSISCVVDGTASAAGSGDMPGRLVFSTTADGASSPTERMRIQNNALTSINGVYIHTTGNAANVHVDSSAYLLRSTSSIKYKTDVEDAEGQYSEALLQCRPVWYRSTCQRDNPAHSYWGFIAEEVAEIDPRLVHWKTTEPVVQENGSIENVPCDPEPEGVAYERFVPHLLNLIKRQKEQIEAMEARLSALEAS